MRGRFEENRSMNPDFCDMLSALNDAEAEYLVVGAFSLAAHGLPRATGDLDLWINPTLENAKRVWRAWLKFGAPTSSVSLADFSQPDIVCQIGVSPRRIDVLTSISGVEFDAAWASRKPIVLASLKTFTLCREHLITNKRASARPKDLADLAWLEAHERH